MKDTPMHSDGEQQLKEIIDFATDPDSIDYGLDVFKEDLENKIKTLLEASHSHLIEELESRKVKDIGILKAGTSYMYDIPQPLSTGFNKGIDLAISLLKRKNTNE